VQTALPSYVLSTLADLSAGISNKKFSADISVKKSAITLLQFLLWACSCQLMIFSVRQQLWPTKISVNFWLTYLAYTMRV